MIVTKDKVRDAVARALLLGATTEEAIATAAASLGLPAEAVREALESEESGELTFEGEAA